MEKQSKLLDKNYLSTRLREIKEIKRGEIKFSIYESDRTFSKSIYINFYTLHSDGYWYKQGQMRISDHEQANCPLKNQIIIDPDACLEKNTKQKFMKSIERCVYGAKRKRLKGEFLRLEHKGVYQNED